LITLHTLSSSSAGNALVLSRDGFHVLVDAGISCRRISTGLQALGLTPGELDAILITHTHTDHIGGLQTLLKRCAAPVYASPEAAKELSVRVGGAAERLRLCPPGEALPLGPWTLVSFPTSHDAPGACGYRLDSVGILTDTGYVTSQAEQTLPGVELLVLEANHDPDRLWGGPYPYSLKQRVAGPEGHLSNQAAAAFAVTAAEAGAREIILAHLSKENNTPAAALSAVTEALETAGLFPRVTVAPRESVSECYRIGEEVRCRK
jgi:phosphoribosyl 1,2-cyclic phosphodiesterase